MWHPLFTFTSGTQTPPPAPTIIIQSAGGKGTDKPKRLQFVEINGKRFRVRNAEEAQELLQQYAQSMQREAELPRVLPKPKPTPVEEDDEELLLLAILRTLH